MMSLRRGAAMGSEEHTNLVTRFNATLEKAQEDKKVLEKIQNRNFFEIFFSNNTRDLARINIAQNELISDLHQVCQELLELERDNAQKFVAIWQEIADFQQENNKKLFKTLSVALQNTRNLNQSQKKQIAIKQKVNNQGIRLTSQEQLNKIQLDIREIAQKKNCSPVKQFLMICCSIKKFFPDFSLTHNNKREIICTIAESDLKFVKVLATDLNQHQVEIANCFQDLSRTRLMNLNRFDIFLFKQQTLKTGEDFYMKDLVEQALDSAVVSEGDRYSEYRDELVSILDDFINKKIDVDGEHTPELQGIRKRLHESQFEIALVGEFQGGKSTTFNTLCGGREISPRGLNGGGIKTSAAVVTVQNIDGDETRDGLEEWTEVQWLSLKEIKLRILSVIKDFDIKLECNIDNFSYPELKQAIKAAWETEPQRDMLDTLRIATLQYRILTDKELNNFLQRQIVPIDEFQKLVVFPLDWEMKWSKGYDADFTLEECCFSIVDRVLVRIHSEALARLGCRLTDCPGLFVSQWDTDRALSAMKDANAIWYLLSGDKQIGENDLRALTRIKDSGWQDKCFFSLNQRKSKSTSERILDSDLPVLMRNGFNTEKVFIYDALTAFRTAQLKLAKNGLPKHDLDCLNTESRNPVNHGGTEKAIMNLLRRHLITIEEDDLADDLASDTALTLELLSNLRANSGIQDILTAIEKMIITEKARSILIHHGSKRCLKVLEHIKAVLLNREKAAKQTLEEAKENAENARDRLDEFIADWKEKFEFLANENIDFGLMNAFFNEYDKEIKLTICERAIEICKEEWKDSHFNANKVNKTAEQRIRDEFSTFIKTKLSSFHEDLPKHHKFQEDISNKLERNLKQMSKSWKDLAINQELFSSIDTAIQENFSISSSTFDAHVTGKIDLPWYSWELLKDVFTLWIRRFWQSPYDRIEDFFRKQDPIGSAYNAFKGNNEHMKEIANFLGTVRISYLKQLEKSFDAMKRRLDSNISKRMEVVKSSNLEREALAREAKDTRTNIIEPYSEKLASFAERVEHTYAE